MDAASGATTTLSTGLSRASTPTPLWIWFAGFLAVLGICFLLDGWVYQIVHEYFRYRRPVPEHLRLPFRIMLALEDWGENVYIVAVAAAMWQLDRTRRSRVVLIAVAAALVSLSIEGVKRMTGRERPDVSMGKTVFRGPSHHLEGGDFQSFPSGHAGSASAYSGVLAACYPPVRYVALALAVGCGCDRIWKERHFLSDVFAATVFGFWFGHTLGRRKWIAPLCRWFDAKFSETGGAAALPPPQFSSRAA